MKNILFNLSLLVFIAIPVSGNSELIMVEDAIEAAFVEVKIDSDLKGTISAAPCDKCKLQRFKLTSATQAEHNGRKVHLSRIKKLDGKPATVVYNIKTKTAVKVIW